MKQFLSFVRKEFYHVLRDRKTLLILFGMPLAQILIFGFALTNEVKNSKIMVVDYAKDVASERLIAEIDASRYFDVERTVLDHRQIEDAFKKGSTKAVVVFPSRFAESLLHENKAQLQIITDASDPNTASTISNYLNAIVEDYGAANHFTISPSYAIVPEIRMYYNPELKGAPNFVPGVMALVLMLVCVMMTAVSIVREKENGTMEVLLVSPFKPILVIFSKAVPYLLLSILNVIFILLLSVFVLDLPVKGNLFLLFGESILFITTCLSLGIFISIQTSSQQVAMLISLMGMMLPTILFSGFLFPIENMPLPLQLISNLIPAKWFYIIVKAIMIKGVGFSKIWKETLVLLGLTIFLLAISLKRFKIRLV
ncbi:MAG: ABC transporter permease [Flavisolibacter sp.]|nr:ABC transporter permease [Flavisolibacter sp.]